MNKIVLTMMLAAACALGSCHSQQPVQNGDVLPTFQIGQAGQPQAISDQDFRGSYGLIVFFSTDCPACEVELQKIQELYTQYGQALRVAAIAREQTMEQVQAYWATKGYTMPVYTDEQRKVYSKFAPQGIPRVYLVNPEGKVMYAIEGYSPQSIEVLQGLLDTVAGSHP